MKKWLSDALERAVRTAAQAALGIVGAGSLGLLDVSWPTVGSVAGLAALVSLLTSVAAGWTGDPTTAGFVTRAGSSSRGARSLY